MSLLSCQSWSLGIWLPIIIFVIVSKLNIQLIRLKRKEDFIANPLNLSAVTSWSSVTLLLSQTPRLREQ